MHSREIKDMNNYQGTKQLIGILILLVVFGFYSSIVSVSAQAETTACANILNPTNQASCDLGTQWCKSYNTGYPESHCKFFPEEAGIREKAVCSCSNFPSSPYCGNGIIDLGEECDGTTGCTGGTCVSCTCNCPSGTAKCGTATTGTICCAIGKCNPTKPPNCTATPLTCVSCPSAKLSGTVYCQDNKVMKCDSAKCQDVLVQDCTTTNQTCTETTAPASCTATISPAQPCSPTYPTGSCAVGQTCCGIAEGTAARCCLSNTEQCCATKTGALCCPIGTTCNTTANLPTCTSTVSPAPPPATATCGNGTVDSGEQCEPPNVVATKGTCIGQPCSATCQCPTAPPGATQCSDLIDNADPEDTLIDLADPGCTNAADNDETNAPPPCSGSKTLMEDCTKRQICANGLDGMPNTDDDIKCRTVETNLLQCECPPPPPAKCTEPIPVLPGVDIAKVCTSRTTGCATGTTCQQDSPYNVCKCVKTGDATIQTGGTAGTTTLYGREESTEEPTDVKCKQTSPPTCGGTCEEPDKVCVSKFSKKKNKMICKCRHQDASDDEDNEEESEE